MSFPRRFPVSGPQLQAQRNAEAQRRLRVTERALGHMQQRGTARDDLPVTVNGDSADGPFQPPDFTSGPSITVNIPREGAFVSIYMELVYVDGFNGTVAANRLFYVGVEEQGEIPGVSVLGLIPLIIVDTASSSTGDLVSTGRGQTVGSSPTLFDSGGPGYGHPPMGSWAKVILQAEPGPRKFTMGYYWDLGITTTNFALTVSERKMSVTVL